MNLTDLVAPALTGVAEIPGDPAAARATALIYNALADAVDAAANQQATALGTVPAGWSGMAAVAYHAIAADRLVRTRTAGGAFREAAGALTVYASELEAAQATAREAAAIATIVRDDAARLDAEAPTGEFLAPGPGDRPVDVFGHELLGYARDASSQSSAAADQARAAAVRAAAALDRLAARAPAVAGNPAGAGQPAGAGAGGSWWHGLLGQAGSFLDGGRDAIVDPFVDAYRLSPLADGWQDRWKDISAGLEHLAIHPDELPGVLLGLDDLRENGYAHWLGGLAPDALGMLLSGGTAMALRARKATDGLDAATGLRRLDHLGDLADVDLAEETERVVLLNDHAPPGGDGVSAPTPEATAAADPAIPDGGLPPFRGRGRDFASMEEGGLWGRQEYDGVVQGLPDDQATAIRGYTGGDSIGINRHLEGDTDIPSFLGNDFDAKVKLIDEALAKKPLPEDVVVYQRTGLSAVGGDLSDVVGKVQTNPGFMSTSLGGSISDGRPVLLRLEVPAGTPGMYVGSISYVPQETELLLGRGLSYQISGVQWLPDGTALVDASILPAAG